tara:strand:+ start:350 stop:1525 length:1176 start_codon:yes stop_codon:yes gene_type:complete
LTKHIPLSTPYLTGSEWKYVKECLDSGWISTGKYISLFQSKIAKYTKSKYAVACVNGTSALHVSLVLAGVEKNDEVIVPSLTFIAPVNAISYCQAEPIFMDSDNFFNIDVNKTIKFIEEETKLVKRGSLSSPVSVNKKTGRRIAALIAVHTFGNAVLLDELIKTCKQRNIKIIEDASESLGTIYSSGQYKGKHTGTIGFLGCLSFNGNKIITAGGGGMMLTNSKKIAERASYLTSQAKDDPLRYVHDNIGFNYRMTNVQAAIGTAQLEKLEIFLEKKRQVNKDYLKGISLIDGLSLCKVPSYASNNHWLNILKIDQKIYGKSSNQLMLKLRSNLIETRPIWRLNHLQKPYKSKQNFSVKRSIDLVKNSLCLPSSSNISQGELKRVLKGLRV